MELDILHRAAAPEIVDFYGAFFIESYVNFSRISCGLLITRCSKLCILLYGVHGRWLARQTGGRRYTGTCTRSNNGVYGAGLEILEGRHADHPSRYALRNRHQSSQP